MATRHDLQAWLALEHEAVWLYGLIGAREESLAKAARTSYDAHRVTRDRLRDVVHDMSGQPVGPALTYGNDVDSPKAARAAASDVEQRIAAACLTLFGHAGTGGRRLAMTGLRRAALAALDWGADVRAFPGLD